jgi:hypothetical protein
MMSEQNKLTSWFLSLIISFLCYGLVAQQATSSVTLEKEVALIGDPITLNIKISVPATSKAKNIDLNIFKKIQNLNYIKDTLRFEKFADLEILDYGTWKPSSADPMIIPAANLNGAPDGKIQNTMTIAIYNEGAFSIPGPEVIADPNVDFLPVNGQILNIQVTEKMLSDSLALHPIKDIMIEEANISDYLKYIYGFLVALALAGIGYYFYKRKKNQENTPIYQEPIILPSADEKAMEALTVLKTKQLWQQGYIKEYQSSLTEIIRTYLEDRYVFDALEMTTDEIIAQLKSTDFDQQYKDNLKEILQVADLVKFAKATPDENIHQIFMDKAVDFVINTKNIHPQKTAES